MPSFFPPPGPLLPPFFSLLVTGAFHPSALLHLAIGHINESPQNEVLILSPSRLRLEQKITSDEWLFSSATSNEARVVLSKITIMLESISLLDVKAEGNFQLSSFPCTLLSFDHDSRWDSILSRIVELVGRSSHHTNWESLYDHHRWNFFLFWGDRSSMPVLQRPFHSAKNLTGWTFNDFPAESCYAIHQSRF